MALFSPVVACRPSHPGLDLHGRMRAGARSYAIVVWCGLAMVGLSAAASGQTAAPATESGRQSFSPAPQADAPPHPAPARQLQAAEEAYVHGAQALERNQLEDAEADFLRAERLNPAKPEYAVAVSVSRQHRLLELVQRAARENAFGHADEAHRLLLQARAIDAGSAVVQQHFAADGSMVPFPAPPEQVAALQRAQDALTLAAPITLQPEAGTRDLHLRANAADLIRQVCAAFGVRSTLTDAVSTGAVLRFDLDHVTFPQALQVLHTVTGTFSVPLQPRELLFSRDNPENRAQYEPLVEETLYLPGTSQADLAEYANMARTVFNLRVVNMITNSASLVLRGSQPTVDRVNATLAGLVDGGAEVLLDLTLYEIDRSQTINLGAQLPASAGVFPLASTAESLINANQSIISEAIANNLITLTGNAYTDALTELEFLLASGTVSSSQFTNLLGVFGHYGGLPLAGTFLGSTPTLNASLTSSDVRILDAVQLRIGDKQEGQFRAGTRYPIETGIYTSSLSSAVSSAVAGLTVNGTSVSSLLSQYLGSSASSIPQIQYEDLGLTVKATPQVLRTGEVQLKLDVKIEALGSGSINSLPILNDRQLTSTVTVPRGKTALLASELSNSELRAVTGLPFLSEIPGFDSTNKSTEKATSELIITLTPHIVREKSFQVTSRRLLVARDKGITAD